MTNPFAVPTNSTSAAGNNPFRTQLGPSSSGGNPFGGNPFGAPSKPGNSTLATHKTNPPNNPFATAATNDEPKRKGRGFREDANANASSGDEAQRKRREDIRNGKKKEVAGKPFGTTAPRSQPALEPRRTTSNHAPNDQKWMPGPTPKAGFAPARPRKALARPQTATTPDAHARRVYSQLHKDGISPPSWPSQPGDPKNKAVMAKFREQYEEYRDKVRASLTKAGLIDDPSKRRRLDDAIDFRGICEDMCPEYEKITRITEFDVVQAEKDPDTGVAVTANMVKKLARSAAGQEAPLPMDVRSVAALRSSLDYLIDELLPDDESLPVMHGFLWDRTRAIRRDFTFFSSLQPDELKTQIYVLENIARFHVTSLHLLSQSGNTPEDFVEQQELEQLGKSLLSLRDLYDDCNVQNIVCDNEAEFRAYYLLFHAQDPNIMEVLQRQWKPQLWKDSDEVRTAVSLVEAIQNIKDFHGPLRPAPTLAAAGPLHSYFRILENPSISYTMACFAECHFAALRRSILTALVGGLARPKVVTKDVTAGVLNEFLRFDTVEEAIEFGLLHELEFEQDEENPDDLSRQRLLLRHRQHLTRTRLQHQFSERLVEKKRGNSTLPDVIHGAVSADKNGTTASNDMADEESLFLPDTKPKTTFGAPSFGQPPTSQSPFGAITQAPTNQAGSGFTPGLSAPAPSEPPAASKSPFGVGFSANPPSVPQKALSALWPQTASAQPSPSPFGGPSQTATSPSPFASNGTSPNTTDAAAKPSPFGTTSQPTSAAGPQPGLLSGTSGSSSGGLLPPASSLPSTTTTAPETKTPSFVFSSATTAPPAGPSSILGNISTASPFGTAFGTSTNSQDASSTPPGSPFQPSKPTPASTAEPATQSTSAPKLTFGPSSSLLPPAKDKSSTIHPSPLRFSVNASPTPPSTTPQPTPTLAPAPSFSALAPISTPAPAPSTPKVTREEIMRDFNKWFLLGDKGLLEEFKIFMVENLLQELYTNWDLQEKEKKRKEEEDADNEKAETWRIYNLRLKFFYRWKRNAREKRQRFLRRSGRDQMREFHAARRQAEREKKEAAARKESEELSHSPAVDRSAELRDMLKRRKASSQQVSDELLASRVLSGVPNEREAIARIVYRGADLPSATTSLGNGYTNGHSRSLSMTPAKKEGPKTRALREEIFGKSGLRKSLPPMSGKRSASPASTPRSTSKVSERWRLKAMGFVQMPDGSVLHESLADKIIHGNKRYTNLWNGTSSQGQPALRSSIGSSAPSSRARASSYSTPSQSTPITRLTVNGDQESGQEPSAPKRKRPVEDEETLEDSGEGMMRPPHKRTVSDLLDMASSVRSQHREIRAMLDDMHDEDVAYREESERPLSASKSREGTPQHRRSGG